MSRRAENLRHGDMQEDGAKANPDEALIRRWRGHAWLLAALMLAVGIAWILLSRNGIDPAGRPIGTDFVSFWSASRLALDGDPAAAWDVARHWRVEQALFPNDPGYAAFFYPPPFLLACWPLAIAPYPVALAIWTAGGFLLWWAAARLHWRDRPSAPVLLLAFPAALVNAGHGQNGFLTAAIIGAGLPLLSRGSWLAGAILGCLVIKPHLAILLPIALALRGEWRAFIATGASAIALCLLSLAAFGTGAWEGFLEASALARQTLKEGLVDFQKMQSAFAAVRLLGGGTVLAAAAQALFTGLAVAALVLVRRAPAPAQNAVFPVSAMLATPFLFDYDLTWLAWPLLWMAGRNDPGPAEKWIVAAALLIPLLSRTLAIGLGLPLAPIVLAAFLAVLVRRARAGRDGPGGESLARASVTR